MKLFNHRISPKISFRKGVRKRRLTENAESVPLGVFSLDASFSWYSGQTRKLPRCLWFSVQFRGAEETAPVATACWRFGPELSMALVNRDL